MPKFAEQKASISKNNNVKPKVIGSVTLNYYSNEALQAWGKRVLDLTNML